MSVKPYRGIYVEGCLSTVSDDPGELCSADPDDWCPKCGGKGRVIYKFVCFGFNRGVEYVDCSTCGGSGRKVDAVRIQMERSL